MFEEYMAGWMFLALSILLMVGFPVTFTLLGVSLFFAWMGPGVEFLNLMPMRIWGVMDNVVLIAVPLFIFMGVTLERSGMAEELLETMGLLFGSLRGGLAISVVVVGAILGASTGIVGATVVTMGLLSVPTMIRYGYDKRLATGTVAASGTLGQIIPPSVILVLLGTIVQVPVGDLFIGAIIPGMLLVVLYIIYILVLTALKPHMGPALSLADAGIDRKEFYRRVTKALVPPMVLILAVLGSIFAGVASPTEAAAVGAVGAVVLTILNGKFNWEMQFEVMKSTTRLTCMVFIILVGAAAFGLVFRELDGDELVRTFLMWVSHNYSKWTVLFIVMALIFLVGFLLDFIEICFIHVPVLAPIMFEFGFDPLWFSILLAVNLQTSFLTPPFGFSLFYLKAVTPPGITSGDIYRGIIPFVILQLVGLAICVFWPELATWLPKVMYTK